MYIGLDVKYPLFLSDDGETDMMQLIDAFHNFANAPTNATSFMNTWVSV
jgi:hypothetical protein